MDIMPSNERSKTRQRSSNKEMGKCDFDVTERKKGCGEVRARDGTSTFHGQVQIGLHNFFFFGV